ncbi:MAG: protein kinase [Lentisphaeria bacterium]|nr:protein kinase [Lentisphaeria bacterium]
MRFACRHCSSVVTCPDASCGKQESCPECGRLCSVPEQRCSPGAVLGDYLIRQMIGSGGMGTVYLAEQLSLERLVALKVLHPGLSGSQSQLERFLKEARLAASMNHPNLIGVYGVGEEDGLNYLAMEYVKGRSVLDLIQRHGRLPLGQAADVAIQVAAGLEAAWERRHIVHCDIKPENILLPDEGGVKIADLGLAERALHHAAAEHQPEMIAGSPYYVCPEIILGQPLDHRSDLYSLGATFYEMITGRPPFQGKDAAEVAGRHLYEMPPDPREHVPELPPAVSDIVARLLRKDPQERYQTGSEFIRALQVEVLLRTTPYQRAGEVDGAVRGAPSRWQCPSCHRLNSENSRYCLDCGAYGWRPCPMCGEDIPLNSSFCTHCGGNLLEQRQGIVRQAEHLLQSIDEAIKGGDYEKACSLTVSFRRLDQAVIPELDRARFQDILSHLRQVYEAEVQSARGELSVERLEKGAGQLYELFGAEAYQWLKTYVDQLDSELAQTVYQAGAALKSKSFATCRRILADIPQWRGGNLGNRLEQLASECDACLTRRNEAMREARAVLDAVETDYGDVVQSWWQLSALRLSSRIHVVPPNETDQRLDQEIADLTDRLEGLVRQGVNTWVEQEQWEAVADLLAALQSCEGSHLVAQESHIAGQVKQEVQRRYQAALDAERYRDVSQAMACWNRLLKMPKNLVPKQIRREAGSFPSRRRRMLTEQRKPVARFSLSAAFILWCMAAVLAVLELVQAGLDRSFEAIQVAEYGVPLVIQLGALGVFSKLLARPGILCGADAVPGHHPAAFGSVLRLMFILSPLSSVLTSLCLNAGRLFPALGLLQNPWLGPLLVSPFWIAGDLVQFRRCRSLVLALPMTLSWGIALGMIQVFWRLAPTDPPLQMAAALFQAGFFGLLLALNYVWVRGRRDIPSLHPALSAASP